MEKRRGFIGEIIKFDFWGKGEVRIRICGKNRNSIFKSFYENSDLQDVSVFDRFVVLEARRGAIRA